jgi:hypothetical protein
MAIVGIGWHTAASFFCFLRAAPTSARRRATTGFWYRLAYRGTFFLFSPRRANVGQTSGDNRFFLQFMLYGPRCANVGQTSGNNRISLQMSDYSDVKSAGFLCWRSKSDFNLPHLQRIRIQLVRDEIRPSIDVLTS